MKLGNVRVPKGCLFLGRWQAVIALLIFLSGCTPNRQMVSCDPPQNSDTNPILAVGPKTDQINISVLIDGTPSMQGYVNGFTNSRYIRTLQLIDSVSSTAWISDQTRTQYYRFGTAKQRLSRENFRRAQLPEFYGNSPDMTVSKIDIVIDEPKESNLSIIITDLYQKNADVTLVNNQISRRYLQNGYAVGVLALKSEFKGTIYDVGIRGQQFEYTTVGKSGDKFHPFYVILLGSYGNINYFFDQFKKNGSDLAKDAQFSVFYPQPVSQAASLDPDRLPADLPKGIRRPRALNDGNVVVRVKDREPVDLLALDKRADSAKLKYQLSFYPLPYVLPLDFQEISVEPKAEKYISTLKDFQPVKSNELTLERWKMGSNSLDFVANINPADLDSGMYRYRFNVYPLGFTEPAWWSTWNSAEGNLDGSKTHNLLPFLRDLKSSTTSLMRSQKPSIAHVCYAIQKK